MSQERIARLQSEMKQAGLQAFVMVDEISLFYMTGIRIPKGVLVVTERSHTLWVAEMFFSECDEAPHINRKKAGGSLFVNKGTIRVGYDPHRITQAQYQELSQDLDGELVPSRLIDEMRAIKDRQELRLIEKSASILNRVFAHLKGWIKEGVTELEVACEFERVLRELGGECASFDPIVAVGKGGATPHYRPGKKRVKQGAPILLDLGVKYQGYCSDMTRVISLGAMPGKMAKLYEIIREAHDEALHSCEVGITLNILEKKAREVLAFYGYEKEFIHSLGHGVGIEVHEGPAVSGRSQAILEEGMVFTIEPGIYLPGVGGVRYENMVHMGKKGPRLLSPPE